MSDLNFEVTVGRPKPKDFKVLSDGLLSHHTRQGHQRTSEEINIFLKDKRKTVYGGVIATVLWNGLEINSLWVNESIRGQGWGTKLMAAAEAEGKARGCTVVYTNTFSWQAPEFYLKLGYQPYGRLDNFPPGANLTYLYKRL